MLLFRYLPVAQVAETDPKQINQVKSNEIHWKSTNSSFVESNPNDPSRIIQSFNWRTNG